MWKGFGVGPNWLFDVIGTHEPVQNHSLLIALNLKMHHCTVPMPTTVQLYQPTVTQPIPLLCNLQYGILPVAVYLRLIEQSSTLSRLISSITPLD